VRVRKTGTWDVVRKSISWQEQVAVLGVLAVGCIFWCLVAHHDVFQDKNNIVGDLHVVWASWLI